MTQETRTKKNLAKNTSGLCANCWLADFSCFHSALESFSSDQIAKQNKAYSKGEYLIRSGDSAKGIFCIQHGLVKVSKIGKERHEFIPWLANEGDVIGLNAIISDETFSFSAKAISSVTACFIPAGILQNLLVHEPHAFLTLLKGVCERLNSLENRIASFSTRKKREVLAEVLMEITSRLNPASDSKVPVQCSIEDLAGLTGTSKNYLHKILADFSENEILHVHNRKVIIKNRQALSLIAAGNLNTA